METLNIRQMREIEKKIIKSKSKKSQGEPTYRSMLLSTAAEAARELKRKNSKERRTTELSESRLRKLKISACLFTAIVLALFMGRFVSGLIRERDSTINTKERALADALAGIVCESEVASRKDITIIALSAEGNRHYKSIMSKIKKAAKGGSVGSINDFWAFSDTEYDPENGGDFSGCIASALRKFPETGTLIVLTGGLIPFFEKGEELNIFLGGKGHLVLVGDFRDGRLVEKIDPEDRVSIVMKDRSGDNSENNYRVFRLL